MNKLQIEIRQMSGVWVLLFAFCLLFSASCTSQPTNLKSFAPNETLIYLETDDLGIALESLTESKSFKRLAQKTKDISSVNGVQLAIAVTGFETSEKQVTEQNAILNFKPRLVAIADTHLWNWQTRTFAEEILGNFVNETYGGEVSLQIADKDAGNLYEWTAPDGRKAYAFVKESLVFFSNDQAAIEKCLAVKRGEAESLMKNEGLRRAFDANTENKLAFGYVSADGIAQIANLVGVSAAIKATEEDDGRSFIARVLPQILRNTTKEIVWTASKTGKGIEDKFSIALDQKYSSIFKETLERQTSGSTELAEFLPSDIFSATRYSLKNPPIAWRSLLLVTKETTDAVSGSVLQQFSSGLLASYGISNAETFLQSVESDIFTAQFDADGDQAVTLAAVKDLDNLKRSLDEIIDFKAAAENREGAEIWYSKDRNLSAAIIGKALILGNPDAIVKCIGAKSSGQNIAKTPDFTSFSESRSTAVTFGRNAASNEKIISVLGELKNEEKDVTSIFVTQTDFTERGIERKTISDFGFIGNILEQIED